jgi:hypothetical protein
MQLSFAIYIVHTLSLCIEGEVARSEDASVLGDEQNKTSIKLPAE